jgi:hypothetical protein
MEFPRPGLLSSSLSPRQRSHIKSFCRQLVDIKFEYFSDAVYPASAFDPHGHKPRQAVTIRVLSSDQNATLAEVGFCLRDGELAEVKYRGGEHGAGSAFGKAFAKMFESSRAA